MSRTISDLTGTNTTLTDAEWLATNAAADPDAVFAFGKTRLKAKREEMRARTLIWKPSTAKLLIDATEDGLQKLRLDALFAAKRQLGDTPYEYSAPDWSFGAFVQGDTLPLDMEDEDGAPVGSAETYWGVNANNMLDMALDASRYVRELMEDWRELYLALLAALEDPDNVTDQNKIDAMKVVIDSFDNPANWPITDIGE